MASRCHTLIDCNYDRFVNGLDPALARLARRLPQRCGLSPLDEVPWSSVFNNIAVLGFPALLFGETTRTVEAETLRNALRGHMFAMIGAFAEDRIADGQIDADAKLLALIDALASERDDALTELVHRGAALECEFEAARRAADTAAVDEQAIFDGEAEGDLARYIEISRAKQSLAFPATLAGASAAGFDADEIECVRELLFGCTLGLQYRDDVVDWLDDHRSGGAWALVLLEGSLDGSHSDDELAQRLHAEGVLVALLERSRDEFARAAQAARRLGATSLAQWAAGQVAITSELAQREAAEPGHALVWERARVARRTAGQARGKVAQAA